MAVHTLVHIIKDTRDQLLIPVRALTMTDGGQFRRGTLQKRGYPKGEDGTEANRGEDAA